LRIQVVALDAALLSSEELVLLTADLHGPTANLPANATVDAIAAAAAPLSTNHYKVLKLKLQSTAAVNTSTVIDPAELPLQYDTDIR
jgi:hypothetical protein